jgi:hypothetical protein
MPLRFLPIKYAHNMANSTTAETLTDLDVVVGQDAH